MREITVTFDYRCPFARNGNEAVVAALREGADLEVRFLPFSLDQNHLEEGEPPVWARDPTEWGSGVLALLYGIAIRDAFPESFLDAHIALFAARHDQARQLNDENVLVEVTNSVGIDAAAVQEEVASGRPLKVLAEEHTEAVERWSVFGVPTFIEGEEAVFVRFMERGRADDLLRALDMIGWDRLNEFKRTRIAR